MEQSELLRHVTRALEHLGLRYFITGSVATIFFGEPRFTNDIDIVVDLPPHRIPELCRAFKAALRSTSATSRESSGSVASRSISPTLPTGRPAWVLLISGQKSAPRRLRPPIRTTESPTLCQTPLTSS